MIKEIMIMLRFEQSSNSINVPVVDCSIKNKIYTGRDLITCFNTCEVFFRFFKIHQEYTEPVHNKISYPTSYRVPDINFSHFVSLKTVFWT